MNLPILQIVAWFVALVELSVGLYVLLLNVWHNANRHVGALLLLTAVNTIAIGMLTTTYTVEEATLPLIIQAMTTPAATIGLLLVGVVLLKPGWMSGRRLWLWLPLYGIGLLTAVLTLVDVWFGTQLWYTGPDPRTYAGGTLALGEYAAGRIALPLRAVSSYLVPAAALVFLLFVALFDKKVTSLARWLAWLLFGALVLASVFQFGLRGVWGPGVAALLTSVAYAVAYSYAAFRQMVSERIYQRGRLQTRLVLLILAISLPLLVAVSLFLIGQAGTLLRQDAAEQLHASRSSLETSTSVWLDLNIKALRQLVNQADIVSMDPARQRPALQAVAAAFPHMYLVSTTDLNGMNVARNDDTGLLNYSDRQWFRDARNGAPLTFQTLIGRTNNKPALVVSMPIREKSGEIVGVGMFATELTGIAQSVEAVRIGKTGYAYIVDANNNVVAHPDPAFLTTGDNQLVDASSFAPVRALRLGAKGVYAYRDQAGARWRADIAEMDYRWGVIVQQQEEELFSTLQLFRGISWAALAVGVILLTGMVWLTMRQAFQPIGALTETVAAITAGDLTRTAPVETEDELGTLAQAFNSMTGQLRGIIENLEQRVTERTAGLRAAAAESVRHTGELERLNLDLQNTTRQAERRATQLAASAQVARAAIQVRDLDRLLPQVTHLISQAFGYYHVGIFIVDEVGRFAILRAANSEGGQRMLARGHKLAVGKEGIVGYVTGTGQPRIALDVGADAVHFDNPDLPQTRSEMALPLRVGDPGQETAGQVFGALNVQSTQEAAFAEEDVAVLSTLADQIAIAIENARLFAQSQAALQEAEQAQRDYIRQEWTQLLKVMQSTSHEYHVSGVPPVGDAPLPEVEQAIQQDRAVAVVGSEIPAGGDDSLPAKAALAIPIKLRGQIIGVIDLQEADAERRWTDEDVALVTAVADQVALALENARLFEQTRQRAQHEQLVSQISAQMRAAPDIEGILRTTVREVRRALGASRGVIRLGGEKQLPAAGSEVSTR
jgi:GAF domain-containing protein/HAMP domain-containing protein